ncbi:hypothetical protein Jab_2c23300 [Janthinobacterium sp. HH01]|uniref:DUF6265 family protein n=1 Tax=Janthinobacterium sp. HH01 TaxID=1198452 RepID=UPI0002AE8A6A|nr:DUF6265 family protein [Janthinobacterium sp. HH01]ELX10243.1 hypothetical protein Jab_2c23300 [Janthinobacterium sp. HH01]
MRNVTVLLAACGALCSAHAAPLEQLSWLSGCWVDPTGEAGSGEQWTAPAAGSMLGMGRTIRGGKLATYEFMRIADGGDGKAVFHAQPAGKPAASFHAIVQSATEVVFENLEHDFPQRVIYRYEAPATLRASIEGQRNGALKRIEFPLVRGACGGTL